MNAGHIKVAHTDTQPQGEAQGTIPKGTKYQLNTGV